MSTMIDPPPGDSAAPAAYSLAQLAGYFLRLGALGFGGPVALVGYMHRDLVERRQWVSEADYKEGLTLAQLMPGPLAAQLAIYLGYVHYGVLGATAAGVAFVLPAPASYWHAAPFSRTAGRPRYRRSCCCLQRSDSY